MHRSKARSSSSPIVTSPFDDKQAFLARRMKVKITTIGFTWLGGTSSHTATIHAHTLGLWLGRILRPFFGGVSLVTFGSLEMY